MTISGSADPVLARFRRDVDAVYGDGVDRVVLFGSRARGDWRPDSDYDIAVFLKKPAGLWDELGRLAHITTDILHDTGALISAKPFGADVYQDRSPLMQEIRTDGIEL
jgi:predicted nucleotidyltransferase|nr:nucleotidyltransferase domain-containing protein [uncultured Rhodopila sp.]